MYRVQHIQRLSTSHAKRICQGLSIDPDDCANKTIDAGLDEMPGI